ncbi:hypothetical protein VTK73DRAFT_4204 [Phialemonium thermophilum]|uniref:Nineteen complex-related protein 2-domain-containing protein n=1 Tax=Phialemonium thermophilum TaxID=223376 RepID=A0ABR3WV83_9PEZI
MSAFGARRKPRIIQTFEEDEENQGHSLIGQEAPEQDQSPSAQAPVRFARRSAKSSSLRKSIAANGDVDSRNGTAPNSEAAEDDEDGEPTVVIKPAISRSGSTKVKKKGASSRLSFGGGPAAEEDGGGEPGLRKSVGQKVLQKAALKKSASLQNLPARFLAGEDDRPRYSKEYLDELQSSTPNTPQNLAELRIADDEDVEMSLEPSELDGATIVDSGGAAVERASAQQPVATILTEAQIREKKERRARLAREADYMALDDGEEDANASDAEGGTVSVSFRTKKKPEPRLVPEDEDLGEGYDEFVEDGGLSLGRKAEREARKRQRQEMAELIQAAEEGSDVDSDDSEAERRAAYEEAQRRAGLDGLQRFDEDVDMDGGGPNIIPKMRPLPDLEDCLQRMRNLVQGLEDEVAKKRRRIAEMKKEREEILEREKEVQKILDEAGAKYQSVTGARVSDMARLAAQSPSRPVPPGLKAELPVERGLESFGTTPSTRPDVEEMG